MVDDEYLPLFECRQIVEIKIFQVSGDGGGRRAIPLTCRVAVPRVRRVSTQRVDESSRG
jgi:hypothetical protein